MPPMTMSTPASVSRSSRSHAVTALALLALLALPGAPLQAQPKKGSTPRTASDKAAPSLVGTWSGTATVAFGDSSLTVPVVYTFTQDGTAIGGTAMVPGQGTGPISEVVRAGSQLTFRVGAPEGKVLDHEGAFTGDGAIEGTVKLDKQPVARFRITTKPR